ncbi:Cytochrome c oxidase subunit 6A [Rhodosporidiobolus nylandii]
MFRAAFQTAARAAPRRAYSTAAPEVSGSGAEFVKSREAIEHHAKGSAELWRKITYYVAFPSSELPVYAASTIRDTPGRWGEEMADLRCRDEREEGVNALAWARASAIIIGLLNAKALADEHEHHLEHIKEENGGEAPERIVYVTL